MQADAYMVKACDIITAVHVWAPILNKGCWGKKGGEVSVVVVRIDRNNCMSMNTDV